MSVRNKLHRSVARAAYTAGRGDPGLCRPRLSVQPLESTRQLVQSRLRARLGWAASQKLPDSGRVKITAAGELKA